MLIIENILQLNTHINLHLFHDRILFDFIYFSLFLSLVLSLELPNTFCKSEAIQTKHSMVNDRLSVHKGHNPSILLQLRNRSVKF